MKCYLDNAATTSLCEEMKSYLISILDVFGNPSSSHSEGVKSRRLIENTRSIVAQFINANNTDEIYFTSSGSSSNTLALNGYILENNCRVLYSPTCHKSILKAVDILSKKNSSDSYRLCVNEYGEIDFQDLEFKLQQDCKKTLVVFEYANSEIGTIQDVKAIVELVHRYNGKVMVDCTGSISSIPLNVRELDIDIATFSGHKIGALKGVGVLYKKADIELYPLIFGSQEHGLFGGTENVIGIASVGKAIELLKYENSTARDYVWDSISNIENIRLIGAKLDKNRLINNLYVCIDGVNGQELVCLMDDLYDIQISTGSACNNGEAVPSSILLTIGIPQKDIYSCIRVSFKGNETKCKLMDFCENLRICIDMLRKTRRISYD